MYFNFVSYFYAILIYFTLKALAGCPIFLTISLNASSISNSLLEINWGPLCVYKPEIVKVYMGDPTISSAQLLLQMSNITNGMSGKYTTHLKIGNLKFPGGWHMNSDDLPEKYPRGVCLDYYISSYNQTEMLTVDCIKIHPNWMSESKDVAKVPLKDLFIPGSHASGAFSIIRGNNKKKYQILEDYAYAQNMDIWSQLVFGIRFLDFEIGFEKSQGGNNFWVVNENKFLTELIPTLRDIKMFLEDSGDIVIINFSEFPIGFYKEIKMHEQLVKILEDEVGNIAVLKRYIPQNKRIYDMSVNEIKATNRSLIILYPLEELPYPQSESQILCPIWKSFTMEHLNHMDALDYMRDLFSKKRTSSLSTKNEPLVDDEGWIFYGIQALETSFNNGGKLVPTKQRANFINPKIVTWLSGRWGESANVVAIDFFTNTKLIDVAIYSNLQKAFHIVNNHFVKFEME